MYVHCLFIQAVCHVILAIFILCSSSSITYKTECSTFSQRGRHHSHIGPRPSRLHRAYIIEQQHRPRSLRRQLYGSLSIIFMMNPGICQTYLVGLTVDYESQPPCVLLFPDVDI